jgi:hypothetical protein
MNTVPHLLGKYGGRVCLAFDVKNCQRRILDPFTNSILMHLHVFDLFSGHVVRPLNTSFIVIVKQRWKEGVRDFVAAFADTIGKVP